jgi:putative phosphonate metabolism protein
MKNYTRFAIYYAPRNGAFADTAAAWLGWDVATGTPCPPPDVAGLPVGLEAITETPRKYGFHGTIKPPFRLAEGTDAGDLQDATAALARSLPPAEMDGLAITRLGRFLAFTPVGKTAALGHIAATAVQELDRFRAPPTEAELEKRRKARLSARQDQYLSDWGYPYVLDEFRFHLTLTGRLERAHLDPVAAAAGALFDGLIPTPFRVEDLCLFGEREDGRFEILHRYALTG